MVGHGLDFDGNDDLVYIGSEMGTALPNQGTVEAWVKMETLPSWLFMIIRRTTNEYSDYTLSIKEGHARFAIKKDLPSSEAVEDPDS